MNTTENTTEKKSKIVITADEWDNLADNLTVTSVKLCKINDPDCEACQ
jgi:endonuclease III